MGTQLKQLFHSIHRMVSNTSAVSNQTNLSTEQMAPTNVLDPQENVIVRFQLFPVPLCGDIAGAHHTIEVDKASSFLRLFFYFWDIPECTQPRIFRKVSQDFGDLPAASGLETGILKFVLPAAVHPVTKFILKSIRYSDNIMYSFKSWKEFEEVRKEILYGIEVLYLLPAV